MSDAHRVKEMGPAVTALIEMGVETVTTDTSVLEVAKKMKVTGIRNIFVVKAEKPVGLVRDRDITDLIANNLDPATTQVERIMLSPPPVVESDAGIGEMATLMVRSGARRILVMKEGKMLGTVKAGNLLSYISRLPPYPIPPASLVDVYKDLQKEE